jgi:predicted permease
MPVAVFNYLFAQRYDRAADEVASVIVTSTLISFATLPLLLLVVL